MSEKVLANKSGLVVEFPPDNGHTSQTASGTAPKPRVKHSSNRGGREGEPVGGGRIPGVDNERDTEKNGPGRVERGSKAHKKGTRIPSIAL